LTGNGLSGDLVQSLPPGSQITDLSLSHNQLTGMIPLDILNIENLDLSYNQFAGEYVGRTLNLPDSNISLEINRLSGQLPVSELERVSNGSLSILRGNMFSCNSIPDNDENSRDYVCGSQNLNDSLFVFTSVFGITVMVMLVACWAHFTGLKQHRLMAALQSRGVLLCTYMTYMQNLDTRGLNYSPAVRKIAMLSGTFIEIMQYAVKLLFVILACSMALYLVKALDSSDVYATHSHTYAWFWTLAYMRGVVPAGMLIMVWAVAISACFYCIIVHPRRNGVSSEAPHRPAHSEAAAAEVGSFKNHVVFVGIAFAFNACITIAVNTLYIFSTQQALSGSIHFCIQLSLSIFRLVYTAVAFPILSRSIRSTVQHARFRFTLLTINNLLLPCVVTALTSDACFQVL
jgi:hypothetical protein